VELRICPAAVKRELRRRPRSLWVGVARGAARDHNDGGKDNVTVANGAVAEGRVQTIP
jgi:hypothetical protein